MDFIVENWPLLVAVVAIAGVVTAAIIAFYKLPLPQKYKKVLEWLLQAVIAAEQKFGAKTGQAKLSYVYDLFIARFPFVSKILSFNKFSELVDAALDKFRKMLSDSLELQDYVAQK